MFKSASVIFPSWRKYMGGRQVCNSVFSLTSPLEGLNTHSNSQSHSNTHLAFVYMWEKHTVRARCRNANWRLLRTGRRVDRRKLMPVCHHRVSECLYTPCDLCATWDVDSRGEHKGPIRKSVQFKRMSRPQFFLHVFSQIHMTALTNSTSIC